MSKFSLTLLVMPRKSYPLILVGLRLFSCASLPWTTTTHTTIFGLQDRIEEGKVAHADLLRETRDLGVIQLHLKSERNF